MKTTKNSPRLTPKAEEPVMLSEEQVFDVVSFAQSLYGLDNFGVYSPWLSNQNLVNLNNNAKIPTYENIVDALSKYKEQATNLQSYSEFMEVFDMLYARTIEYYTNLLSFDLQITCKNAKKEDYKTDNYKADKARIYKFLDNFDYKSEFKKVVKQLLRHEVHYTSFRTNLDRNNPKYALQTLPQDRCILTGYFESVYCSTLTLCIS